MPLRGLSTPGQGQGEGSAGDKFRVSGTLETVEGAEANKVSGVLSEAGCCRIAAHPLYCNVLSEIMCQSHKPKLDLDFSVGL